MAIGERPPENTGETTPRLSLATRSLFENKVCNQPASPQMTSSPGPPTPCVKSFRRFSPLARRLAMHPNAHDWTHGHAPPNVAHLRSILRTSSQPPFVPMLCSGYVFVGWRGVGRVLGLVGPARPHPPASTSNVRHGSVRQGPHRLTFRKGLSGRTD